MGRIRNTMGVTEKNAFLMGNRDYVCSGSVRIRYKGEQLSLDDHEAVFGCQNVIKYSPLCNT
jgi:hypothetical protein